MQLYDRRTASQAAIFSIPIGNEMEEVHIFCYRLIWLHLLSKLAHHNLYLLLRLSFLFVAGRACLWKRTEGGEGDTSRDIPYCLLRFQPCLIFSY